jgi:hypothetical protein
MQLKEHAVGIAFAGAATYDPDLVSFTPRASLRLCRRTHDV